MTEFMEPLLKVYKKMKNNNSYYFWWKSIDLIKLGKVWGFLKNSEKGCFHGVLLKNDQFIFKDRK